jgi:hypothetical protein
MERVEKVAKFLLNFSQLNKAIFFFGTEGAGGPGSNGRKETPK